MVFNDRTPELTVDPETYKVTVDGEEDHFQTGREASADTALQSVLNNFKPLHSGYLIIKMIFAGLLFMEFCENFYKNLPNNIMTVLSV